MWHSYCHRWWTASSMHCSSLEHPTIVGPCWCITYSPNTYSLFRSSLLRANAPHLPLDTPHLVSCKPSLHTKVTPIVLSRQALRYTLTLSINKPIISVLPSHHRPIRASTPSVVSLPKLKSGRKLCTNTTSSSSAPNNGHRGIHISQVRRW